MTGEISMLFILPLSLSYRGHQIEGSSGTRPNFWGKEVSQLTEFSLDDGGAPQY